MVNLLTSARLPPGVVLLLLAACAAGQPAGAPPCGGQFPACPPGGGGSGGNNNNNGASGNTGTACTNSSVQSTSWSSLTYSSSTGLFSGKLTSLGCPSYITTFTASQSAISATIPSVTSWPSPAGLTGPVAYSLTGMNIYNPLEARAHTRLCCVRSNTRAARWWVCGDGHAVLPQHDPVTRRTRNTKTVANTRLASRRRRVSRRRTAPPSAQRRATFAQAAWTWSPAWASYRTRAAAP